MVKEFSSWTIKICTVSDRKTQTFSLECTVMTDILRCSRSLLAYVTPSSPSSSIDCGMHNIQEEQRIPTFLSPQEFVGLLQGPKEQKKSNVWGIISQKFRIRPKKGKTYIPYRLTTNYFFCFFNTLKQCFVQAGQKIATFSTCSHFHEQNFLTLFTVQVSISLEFAFFFIVHRKKKITVT